MLILYRQADFARLKPCSGDIAAEGLTHNACAFLSSCTTLANSAGAAIFTGLAIVE
jgi:hypothetical protein